MRRILIGFVLKLIAVSIVLYVLWEWEGRIAYAVLFGKIAVPIYRLLGVQPESLRAALDIVLDRFFNLLPFLSLMLAGWGLSLKRRVLGTLTGLLVLFAWHMAFTLIVRAIVGAHHLDATAYRELSPLFLFSDALPFLLWLLISRRPLMDLLATRTAWIRNDKE